MDYIPHTYNGLMLLFPLRPIKNRAEYRKAIKVSHLIGNLSEPSEDQQDYLNVLNLLIETWK